MRDLFKPSPKRTPQLENQCQFGKNAQKIKDRYLLVDKVMGICGANPPIFYVLSKIVSRIERLLTIAHPEQPRPKQAIIRNSFHSWRCRGLPIGCAYYGCCCCNFLGAIVVPYIIPLEDLISPFESHDNRGARSCSIVRGGVDLGEKVFFWVKIPERGN